MRIKMLSIMAALLCSGCAAGLSRQSELVLEHGDHYQLMLVHRASFDRNHSPATFHDCVVDKSINVSGSEQRRMIAMLRADLSTYGPGMYTGCIFSPHYAVHITQGSHTLDLEICFNCMQCEAFNENGKTSGFSISSDGKRVFASLIPD